MIPLAFWQFGSAGMLAWGLAAALPIVIHLWARRTYRQERWAAMTFLLAALRISARRIQIEQWILLALRTAILLLFALALADPQFSPLSSGLENGSAGPTHVVLVFDGSYSMGYRANDKSRFETAQELARRLVTSGGERDGYSLVLMGQPPRVVISQPVFDRGNVAQEIDDLELRHGGANLPATLAQVEALLRKSISADGAGRFASHRVCIFSDLQKATWGDAQSADCRAQLSRLESLTKLELVDLGESDANNLAIAQLETDQPVVTTGREVQLQADIRSFSHEDVRRRAIEFFVDGVRIAEKRVDCPAGGQTRIAIAHRFDAPGEHVAEAHLADDGLPLDNRRWLSVPVRESVRVLCVGGRPNETRFVALALAPEKSTTGFLQVVEAPESRLLDGDLAEFDCLIVSNISRFSRAEAVVLHRFLVGGGGTIFFVGDQTQPDNYNQLLVDDPALRLLPARLGEVAPTAAYAFDPLNYQHPIVSPFRGFPKAGLLTTPIWKYLRITPLEGAKTAVKFSSGDPAIVETQIGRGRCFLVPTAGSPDSLDQSQEPPRPWTALATWPSFPPLIHEMVRLAVAARGIHRNVLVGEDLDGSAPLSSQSTIVLTGPGGMNERLPLVSNGGEGQWTYSSPAISGIYEAHVGPSAQRFAVNVDTAESDLTRLEPELLPSQFHRESAGTAGEELASAENTGSYFRWLLGAVLVLLIVEPCLAWQFGRGRA